MVHSQAEGADIRFTAFNTEAMFFWPEGGAVELLPQGEDNKSISGGEGSGMQSVNQFTKQVTADGTPHTQPPSLSDTGAIG